VTKGSSKSLKTAKIITGAYPNGSVKKPEKVKITVMDYDQNQFQEKEVANVEECFAFRDTSTVTWINIDGIHDLAVNEKISEYFNFHPLILEDMMNLGQRPKIEDYWKYLFVVSKMLYHDEKKVNIIIEQVSFILGSNFVISFQESEGDVFNAIRDRIRYNKGRIRQLGPDYLLYCLMDAIVDNYFVILETIGEDMTKIEEILITNPVPKILKVIHRMKRDTIILKKAIWPFREVVGSLARGDSNLVQEPTRIYFRSVYDHTAQVIDTVEATREMASSMIDVYLLGVNNRMNEIMKVLAIFASIFIPLTFAASVYGMNFQYMPWLHSKWGFSAFMGIMSAIALVLLIFFKRKKWF
jgi:magnesium transporter